MQAWIIHWKITNIPVHNTKYATRNNGNRCKEEIVAKSQYQELDEEKPITLPGFYSYQRIQYRVTKQEKRIEWVHTNDHLQLRCEQVGQRKLRSIE